MKITKEQLKEIIKEEALKLKKIQTLKEQAKFIKAQLREMEEMDEAYDEVMEEDDYTFEEGFLKRAIGWEAPKSLMSAIANAKSGEELVASLSSELEKVGGGKVKEVEWFEEFKEKVTDKLKALKLDGAWANANIKPIMQKSIKKMPNYSGPASSPASKFL